MDESPKNPEKKIESNLSALANEFVPQRFLPNIKDVCDYLSQTLDYLHTDPEELPAVLNDLEDQLMIYINDLQTLDILIHVLINKCIETPNFQYMGAQCSVHLCHTICTSKEAIFHQLFLKQCNLISKEFMNSDQLSPVHNNFTLFITELMLILKEPGGKYNILIRATIDLLLKSLHFISDESVKCLQQVIKMTGFVLQDEEPEYYKKLLQKIKSLIEVETITKRQREILLGIVSRERIPEEDEQVLNDMKSMSMNLSTAETAKEDCTYDICHDVTVVSQNSQQYVIPNEDAEPEIYEDYELFVSENDLHMDDHVEADYDNYLKKYAS